MIERLARWRLWWSHYYTFNFAHSPLCERHLRNTWRIGRVHVCRSCILLWSGVTAAALFFPAPLVVFYVMLAPTLIVSVPSIYGRLGRRLRDVARVSAGIVAGSALALLWTEPWLGIAHVAALGVLHRVYMRERARRASRMCDGCPELAAPGICSGYARQAEHVRLYEAAIYGRLMKRGYRPKIGQ